MFSDKFLLTKAVLDGRKTQTRRIVSQSLIDKYEEWVDDVCSIAMPPGSTIETLRDWLLRKHTRYCAGEVVAVAQSYKDCLAEKPYNGAYFLNGSAGWNNKMFVEADKMPHQICITDMRVERIQDISDVECLKEGIQKMLTGCEYYQYSFYDNDKGLWNNYKTPREAFAHLINQVSGKDVWSENPYVFVYDFELVK